MSKSFCVIKCNGLYAKRISGVLSDSVDVVWVKDLENASRFTDLVAVSIAREFRGAQAIPESSLLTKEKG